MPIALLTRVGAYYHDGELARPYFFVENQQGLSNPHDRLDPTQALTYWRAMCAMD